jgi:hypothetical protein
VALYQFLRFSHVDTPAKQRLVGCEFPKAVNYFITSGYAQLGFAKSVAGRTRVIGVAALTSGVSLLSCWRMRSNVIAIFCCLMTALCPAFCANEAISHAQQHDLGSDDGTQPAHDRGHTPHQRHDDSGDPIPKSDHTCLCSGNALTTHAIQLVSYVTVAFVGMPPTDVANYSARTRWIHLLDGLPWERSPAEGGILPLLI